MTFVPSSDLQSGTVSWRVASIDLYGNTSAFATSTFMIDSNKPTVAGFNGSPLVSAGLQSATVTFNELMDNAIIPTVTFGTTAPYNQQAVTSSVWNADEVTLEISVNIPADGTLDGANIIAISGAKDIAGNEMNSNSAFGFYIDTTAPVITMVGSDDMTIQAGSSYTEEGATWMDAHDGNGFAIVSGGVNTAIVDDYIVSYNKTDMAGNTALTATRTVHVIDTTAPVVSTVNPSDASTISDVSPVISATFVENGTGIDQPSLNLYVDGMPIDNADVSWSGDGLTASFNNSFAYDDGIHDVAVSVSDNEGNLSDEVVWTFTISTAPTIASLAPAGGMVVAGILNSTNNALNISGTVQSDGGGIQTVYLYENFDYTEGAVNIPLASSIILSPVTNYSIDLSTAELATLMATDGIKNLTVQRVGFTGNLSVPSVVSTILVDKSAPTIPDSAKITLTQNPLGGNDTIVGASGAISSDTTEVLIYDNSDALIATLIPVDGGFSETSIGDNLYPSIKISARDAAGNESAKLALTNDIVAPSAPAIASPVGTTYGKIATLAVSGTAEANASVKMYDGATLLNTLAADGDGNFGGTLELGADATYNITAVAVDMAGNISGASNIIVYILDRIAPVVGATLPTALTKDNKAPISIAWSDAGVGFSADPTRTLRLGDILKPTVWDGVANTMTYIPMTGSSNGPIIVIATITDLAGNTATTTFTFTIDTVAPVITVIGGDETVEIGSAYADAGATATDTHDGDLTASIVPTSTVDTAALGNYSVIYNVSDMAGNTAVSKTRIVQVNDSIDPTVDAGADKLAKGVFTQNGSADGTGTAITTYLWEKVSGTGNITFGSANAINTTISADADGAYVIKLTVTDQGSNSASDTMSLAWDGTAPTILEVSSTTANGLYKTGDIINVEVQLSENVNASGTNSRIALDLNGIIQYANYVSGSGTDDLVYQYTVLAGDESLDLGYALITDFDLNGDVFTDPAGNSAVLTLPANLSGNSLSDQSNIAIDAILPVITMIEGDKTIEFGTTYVDAGATATDNRDVTITGNIISTSTINSAVLGDYTVVYNVTDAAGNVALPITRNVHIVDTTDPIIDLNGVSPMTIAQGSVWTDPGVAISDNYYTIDPATVVIGGTVDTNTLGAYPLTYDITDGSGNSAVQVPRIVNVTDQTAPVGSFAVRASTSTDISNPELYTRTTALKFAINATDNIAVATMAFKDDNSAGWSAPVAFVASTTFDYTLSSTTDGTRTVYVQYCDAATNCSEVANTIIFDNNPPLSTTSPLDGTYTNDKQLQFTWTEVSDQPAGVNSGIQYYLISIQQGPAWTAVTDLTNLQVGIANSYKLSLTQVAGLVDGTYRIKVQARDNAGKINTAQYSDGVVLDTVSPIIALTGLTPLTVEKGIAYSDLGATWTDSVDVSGDAIASGTVDTSVVGPYTVRYNYTDRAGNQALEVSRTVNVTDTTAPVLIELASVGTPTKTPVYRFSTDEAGTISYLGACSSTTATTTATLGENNIALIGLTTGSYAGCQIKVTDAVGNPSNILTLSTFEIDVDGPVLTVDALTTKLSQPALSGTTDDALATITVRVNGVDYLATNNGTTWSVASGTIAPLADGIYDIAVTSTDALGNIGNDVTTGELKIDNAGPTVVADSHSPIGSTTNRMPTVRIKLTDSISGVNPATIALRINGIAVVSSYNATTGEITYTPTRALSLRKYTVTVDAKDMLLNAMPRYSFNFTIVAE
jgi:hypothetical protein